MEDTEKDRLIAQFMGYNIIYIDKLIYNSKNEDYISVDIYSKIELEFNEEALTYRKGDIGNYKIGLGYHCSWEELMEVVERIESIYLKDQGYFQVNIIDKTCIIKGSMCNELNSNHYLNDITTLNSKFGAVYQAVVKFIEWYNENVKYHIKENNGK